MRKTVKRIVRYECGTCRASYAKASDATRCERAGVEPKRYKKGDRVRARERRTCAHGGTYVMRGTIVRCLRPVACDPEVFAKGFGIAKTEHLRLYEIAYVCPRCGGDERVRYPTDALRPDERR